MRKITNKIEKEILEIKTKIANNEAAKAALIKEREDLENQKNLLTVVLNNFNDIKNIYDRIN